jgi:hypothetical protein
MDESGPKFPDGHIEISADRYQLLQLNELIELSPRPSPGLAHWRGSS